MCATKFDAESHQEVDPSSLKALARECGADLVGIADLALLHGIETEPADLLEGFTRAVSMAVRLADGVMDTIVDRPTPIYQQHYAKVNLLLDDLAIRVTQFIQRNGGKALPIPASQVLDREQWRSYISHKAVAIAAGMGWQGKSLLLVNREYGPRVRLVTVLTDIPYRADPPVKNLCAKCTACTDACPSQAIKNVNTERHYESREQALHFQRCVDKVWQEFRELPFIENPICGVCIAVCPFGKRKKKKKSQGTEAVA